MARVWSPSPTVAQLLVASMAASFGACACASSVPADRSAPPAEAAVVPFIAADDGVPSNAPSADEAKPEDGAWMGRVDSYGSGVALVGDWDRDGRSEIAVAHGPAIDLFSGGTGALVARIEAPRGIGADLQRVADVDGDGVDDLLTSSPARDAGCVALVGSRSRRVLREFSAEEGERNFGCASALWSSDGSSFARCVLALAPSERARIAYLCAANLDTGERVWRVELPFTGWDSSGRFGPSLSIVGDVDRDHVADVAVCINGRCVLVSGREHAVLDWQPQRSRTDGWAYAYSACAAGDIDGDGAWDVAIGDARLHGFDRQGTVTAHSGADGRVLWTTRGERGFGFDIHACPDVDGDGRDDLVVGEQGYFESSVALLRGLDGCVLSRSLWNDPDLPGLGWHVDASHDVDGDDVVDMVAARFDPHSGTQVEQGAVVFSGKSGTQLLDLSFAVAFPSDDLPRNE